VEGFLWRASSASVLDEGSAACGVEEGAGPWERRAEVWGEEDGWGGVGGGPRWRGWGREELWGVGDWGTELRKDCGKAWVRDVMSEARHRLLARGYAQAM
jgi:hypothetical protein